MFDISWTEFLLIGVVALIVIGPKELPGVMRTLGQYTRKARSMAAEFQNQFQEAMREAEMADLKKQVDDMASDIKNYDPLKDVRSDFDSMGKDIEKSLTVPADEKPAEPQPAVTAEQPPLALTPDTQTAPALSQPDPGASASVNPADTVPVAPEPDALVAAADPVALETAVPVTAAEPAVAEPATPAAAAEPAAPVAEPAASERS
jgi:sec-independent protein translocase protein TatB